MIHLISFQAIILCATVALLPTRSALTHEAHPAPEAFENVGYAVAIAAAGPEKPCVVCIWHQRCPAGTHTADVSGSGTHANPHVECVGNPDPSDWCAGHPSCSVQTALADFGRMTQLAFKALDGDQSAIAALLSDFPGFVQFNSSLDTYDILTCDGDDVFAAIPISGIEFVRVGE